MSHSNVSIRVRFVTIYTTTVVKNPKEPQIIHFSLEAAIFTLRNAVFVSFSSFFKPYLCVSRVSSITSPSVASPETASSAALTVAAISRFDLRKELVIDFASSIGDFEDLVDLGISPLILKDDKGCF